MLGVLSFRKSRGVRDLDRDISMFTDPYYLQTPATLEQMLSTQWETDAHFTCYYVEGLPQWPRINKTVLPSLIKEGDKVLTQTLALDYDLPNHAEWDSNSLDAFAKQIDSLDDKHRFSLGSWSALYTTLHGSRILYSLSSPIPVQEAEERLCWLIHEFSKVGIEVDARCKDWTRLFRCPRVLRNGKRTEDYEFFLCEYRPNEILDVSKMGTMPTSTVAKKRPPVADKTVRPHVDEIDSYIYEVDAKGNRKPNLAWEKAKKALKKSDFYRVCFEGVASGWKAGEYNNQIALYLGKTVPALVDLGMSPQECFSIISAPLRAIPETDRNYLDHSWNLLLDIFNRETVKINDRMEVRAKKEADKADALDKMVAGMKKWCQHPDLFKDATTARAFVKSRILISFGRYFYHLQEDGFINDFHCEKGQLIPRIRKTYLGDIITIQYEGNEGQLIDISPNKIANNHSTVVFQKEMRLLEDIDGYIHDMDGQFPLLVVNMYRRSKTLEPQYNAAVDEWLHYFGNVSYPEICHWIGHALAFEDGPICALSLQGHPNAGKLMFTLGLAECLEIPVLASVDDLTSQSSTLTHTPFLVVNEGFPKSSRFGKDLADQFKGLTSGDPICINEKHKQIIYIQNPIRMIFTANHNQLLMALTQGKSMNLDSRRALGQRVLHINIPPSIDDFFNKIGNFDTTGKPGARWVGGSGKPSNYIVARHFLWLYQNRDQTDKSTRFLVMGNTSPDGKDKRNDVFSNILTNNDASSPVCLAVINMLDKGAKEMMVQDGHIYVTTHSVLNIVNTDNKRMSLNDVSLALQNLSSQDAPVAIGGIHYSKLDTGVLYRFAVRHGCMNDNLKELYMETKK